jgi:predicted DNA-binding protein (MmcQ/YjbR family)
MHQKVGELLEKLRGLDEWSVETNEQALAIYKRGDKIFLIVHEASDPLRVEVGVGRDLAKLLAEKYESVMASRNMAAKEWVEVISAGQLDEDEIIDLIRASWERATP